MYRTMQPDAPATHVITAATIAFCSRFMQRGNPNARRMVRDARGTDRGSATCRDRLLADCLRLLAERALAFWPPDDSRGIAIRRFCTPGTPSFETYRSYIEDCSLEIATNALICIIDALAERTGM